MTLEEAAVRLQIDLDAALDRVVNNRELYIRLLKAIITETDMQQMENFRQEKDYVSLEDAVHSLKGSAGSLGITGLAQTADALVQTIRKKQYENIEHLFGTLQEEYEQLCVTAQQL